MVLGGALDKNATSLNLAWNLFCSLIVLLGYFSSSTYRDQDYYYGVVESGSVGYVKQVHVTRDLNEATTVVQPLQE